MTERSTAHATFVIERTYPQAPARVFAAWASAEAKATWFFGPPGKWSPLQRDMDFRPGGRECVRGALTGGPVTDFQAHYFDIVPDERIVYAYEMHLDLRKISVSLATIEFKPAGSGTRLVLTEQGAFLDGYDDAGKREGGSGVLMDQLGAALRRAG
jgi:uncharacterized protein YndB with AHSA1/START domain